MISRSSHVVVVGGGIIGTAVAYVLARSRIRVTLVEPDAFGAHASGKNPGNLNPILNASPSMIPFALDSFRRHLVLAEELAALGCERYALEPVQRILVALDETDCEKLESLSRLFDGREGFSARLLDSKALREREPRLSAEVLLGLLVLGNMSVDSRALTRTLAEGAERLGAELRRGRVRALATTDGRVKAVGLEGDEIPCDAVVLATGPWVAETQAWLGVTLPIEPVKGQMLKMRLPGAPLAYDFSHGAISLYRRGKDEVWVGVTTEKAGPDESLTREGLQILRAGAERIMPEMARATLIEHCASVRPQAPSGLPILGRAPGCENAYVANGGGTKGVLLGPAIAQAIHDLLLTGRTPLSHGFQAV